MPVARKTFPSCPIERTLAVLSGRWKAMLVWQLFSGRKRYSDLLRVVPGISERVLTQALKELAQDGVIRKTQDFWQVTELGNGLEVAMTGLLVWGEQHAAELPKR